MQKIILTLNADGSENKRELVEEKPIVVGTLKSLQEEMYSWFPEKGLHEDKLKFINDRIKEIQASIDLIKGTPTETVTLPAVEKPPQEELPQ